MGEQDTVLEGHEKRIGNLEDDMKPVYGLPDQIKELILVQRDTNEAIRELAKSSPSKDVCNEKHKVVDDFIKEFKDFRRWVYGSIATAGFLIIMDLIKMLPK